MRWATSGCSWCPAHAADLALLGDDIAAKTRLEDIAAYTRVLDSDPKNPLRHDAVGMLYLQDGRPQKRSRISAPRCG